MDKQTPRLIAKAKGEQRYKGKRCINGHDGTRYVANRQCIECNKVYARNYNKTNKRREYMRNYMREYYKRKKGEQ